MRFNRKNVKFVTDLITLILAVSVIVLAIVGIIGGQELIFAFVFYAGAAMFISNIVRGFLSKRYLTAAFILPAIICVAGGLMAEGMIEPWIF
ncbi:MAG: hypothetical protein II966_04700 [Lachnospiraceae bacterium]|nr:hypothetical protein [Lachnospiraceae bacterium]